MLICLLTRLGGIPYAFFMRTAYYCGHLETVSPLFSILVEKCQIIKGVLMTERKVRPAAVENRAASSVLKDELLYQQRLLRFQTTILSLQCLILLILGDTGEISPPHLKVAIWVDVKHRSLRMQAHVQL